MSALENKQVWSDVGSENLSSKYEKCRNITEEIYKRINITFEIKKLENPALSDASEHSEVIDSNDLSNETDLFACDKTDSLPSSEEKNEFVNINNNVEPRVKEVKVTVYKRPRKRFRKRVKKRQSKPKASDSDGSSDEAPLSRIIDTQCVAESPEGVMGVPGVIILTKDVKPRTQSPEKKLRKPQKDHKQSTQTIANSRGKAKQATDKEKNTIETEKSLKIVIDKREMEKIFVETMKKATIDVGVANVKSAKSPDVKEVEDIDVSTQNTAAGNTKDVVDEPSEKEGNSAISDVKPKTVIEIKPCSQCSLTFRGDRGLRRHMAMTHIIPTTSERDGKSS